VANYNLDLKICFYTIVTLRYNWYKNWAYAVREFYPDVNVVIIDNCGKEGALKNLGDVDCLVFKHADILPLTVNQFNMSQLCFEQGFDFLVYSADDVIFKCGGFVEEAVLKMLSDDSHIVSFSTDKDPVAYIYDRVFFEEVGFNLELKGKEDTDLDLVAGVVKKYGSFPYIGEYWRPLGDHIGWESKYVEHARNRVENGKKEDVTEKLNRLGIATGVKTNKEFLRK
jgi:hypothetical protein